LVERAPAKAGDLGAIDEHPAPVGAQEADQMPEEDRFAAAASADNDRDRARGDLQVEPTQHRLPAERLDQALDLDHRLASPPAAARTATITDSPRLRLRSASGLSLARPRSPEHRAHEVVPDQDEDGGQDDRVGGGLGHALGAVA